jgi:hypothetical protein
MRSWLALLLSDDGSLRLVMPLVGRDGPAEVQRFGGDVLARAD